MPRSNTLIPFLCIPRPQTNLFRNLYTAYIMSFPFKLFLGFGGVLVGAQQGGSNEAKEDKFSPAQIRKERDESGFDPSCFHVCVCGSAGSGKSSLVNAARGIKNSKEDASAAPTGTTETTRERASYANPRRPKQFLYDTPGHGTQAVSAQRYYYDQKIYLFDLVIVMYGERLREDDVEILKACRKNGTEVILVRSKSDGHLAGYAEDNDVEIPSAGPGYVGETTQEMKETLERVGFENVDASQPEKPLVYIVCTENIRNIVNHQPTRREVIHERLLLAMLDKMEYMLVRPMKPAAKAPVVRTPVKAAKA
ncbi:hypothetical protein EJ06DRAFT_556619 [Trichodelitschia bisporula]|uniref:IRG-type G domain-containing protein n=1 Tax=Trichodelitschia bisporula TaxID=703511 RepID=A0A6G1HWP3_9PEZI|nr:hypothetical protein EJ06DRAFT_556619 [Trichodelitschia bisporula]